ncbi:MAG: acetyl-CoA decarbonylase/synthase complex subunit delta [Candidatus Omnitrophota bacterium]
MAIELYKEKWVNNVNEVILGATKEEGGSRAFSLKVGGESCLPYLFEEGSMPNAPVVAQEIWDIEPTDWPEILREPFKDVLANPLEWAEKAVKAYGANLLCLKLQGAHPDSGNRPNDELVKILKDILKTVNVPLIVSGCGDDAKDNLLMPLLSEATKGERILFGDAVQDNYKTITASVLADGHNIIAESPIDINIAKQLNILITDMGLPGDKIVINPTVGALGYGLEYAYSIMERARLAALAGDKMMSMPFICFIGQEATKAKEAKATIEEHPQWGKELERGIVWEAVTACAFLQSGADILVMRHPQAIKLIKETIEELMSKSNQ